MRPVKLHLKRDPHDAGNTYYSVSVPREVGDEFPDPTWFWVELLVSNDGRKVIEFTEAT